MWKLRLVTWIGQRNLLSTNSLYKVVDVSWNQKLGREAVEQRRGSCAELSKLELDMAILGQLAASEHRVLGVTPKRARGDFFIQGMKVCKAMFLFAHGLGEKRFKNLKSHFSNMGLSPRSHGNLGRIPHHAVSLDDARHMVTFLFEYAELHALLLPGRVPGYNRTDLQVQQHIH